LVETLRRHLDRFGTGADGRLFVTNPQGGPPTLTCVSASGLDEDRLRVHASCIDGREVAALRRLDLAFGDS
jgi:hypothetical protein